LPPQFNPRRIWREKKEDKKKKKKKKEKKEKKEKKKEKVIHELFFYFGRSAPAFCNRILHVITINPSTCLRLVYIQRNHVFLHLAPLLGNAAERKLFQQPQRVVYNVTMPTGVRTKTPPASA
jgi:hypothetical protein